MLKPVNAGNIFGDVNFKMLLRVVVVLFDFKCKLCGWVSYYHFFYSPKGGIEANHGKGGDYFSAFCARVSVHYFS